MRLDLFWVGMNGHESDTRIFGFVAVVHQLVGIIASLPGGGGQTKEVKQSPKIGRLPGLSFARKGARATVPYHSDDRQTNFPFGKIVLLLRYICA